MTPLTKAITNVIGSRFGIKKSRFPGTTAGRRIGFGPQVIAYTPQYSTNIHFDIYTINSIKLL